MGKTPLLQVHDLTISFRNEEGVTRAVDSVSFDLFPGETLAIVGESGSGKSVSTLSILGLIDPPAGKIEQGEILFSVPGESTVDLLQIPEKAMRRYRGKEIAMIFQEPMTSLNPVLTCGTQVVETLLAHLALSGKEAKVRTIDLFREVMLPRPEEIFKSYPHQSSGG